jgi:hypothetical protein
MYQSLVNLFPFVHSVLALTVSHLWYGAVKLSSQMFPDDDAVSDSDSDFNEDDTLTKRQHGILEFFIAELHLCSQKNMRHWAMIMPLTCHSHGHVSLPASHPLYGAGCSCHVLWKSLNELFDQLVSACKTLSVSSTRYHWPSIIGRKCLRRLGKPMGVPAII